MSLRRTPTGHRPVAAALAVLSCLGTLGLAGCASTRHPTVAELRAVPGATARYPGSEVYVDDEQEAEFGIDSGSPAHLRVFGCATGAQIRGQVIDWYTRTLEGAGWELRPSGPQREDMDGLTSGYTWRRGEREFTLRLATTGGLDDLAVSSASTSRGVRSRTRRSSSEPSCARSRRPTEVVTPAVTRMRVVRRASRVRETEGMRRPRLRALTEDGQSYDDPSEDVLYLLVQDIAAGERSWVIVEQVAHPSGQTYTQLLRLVDGSYQVERRPGQGERIRHGAYSQHSAGSMALSSGVTGAHLS